MSAGALPTFLVIGAAKCGTSSLHQYLGEHPQIGMSRTKELNFFQDTSDPGVYAAMDPALHQALARRRNWRRGIDWYRAQFDPALPARGESSPGYTQPHFSGVAERMASLVPDAQLVYVVRDPVERALSAYRWRRGLGHERQPPDVALVPGGYYCEASRYAACLGPYLDRFPRERILIVEAELLDADRRATMQRVFGFLGVEEDFWSPAFERRWNVTAEQGGRRWRAMSRLRERPWWGVVASRVPRRALWAVQRATTGRASGAPEAEPAVPGETIEALREDAARFRAVAGRDFAHWPV